MRSIFGWDLPPGVRSCDLPGNQACGPCECCGHDPESDCICPECATCGSTGDPECYRKHGLEYTREQEIGKAKMRIADYEDRIVGEQQYIAELLSEDNP